MLLNRFIYLIIFFLYSYNNLHSQIHNDHNIKFGIDNLISREISLIKGKKILLLCNNASRNHAGVSSFELLKNNSEINLVGILTPEHGYYTTVPAGELVEDQVIDGVPVYSLYKSSKSTPKEIIDKAEIVVIDIQDIGIRSYTYLSTVYKTMEACALYKKPVIIVDRPNPLGGISVDGNVNEPGTESFVGIIPISYIHGCTIGELALMINEEGWLFRNEPQQGLKCNLTIIKMSNWKRWMTWEDTGALWIPTSPHIPTTDAVRGAAVMGTFGELGIISIGIGTTSPFQYIGMPDLDINKLASDIKKENFIGIKFIPTSYQPFYGMYSNKSVNGFLLKFESNNNIPFYSSGIKLFYILNKNIPSLFDSNKISDRGKSMFMKVTGSKDLLNKYIQKAPIDDIIDISQKGLKVFFQKRQKYLLY